VLTRLEVKGFKNLLDVNVAFGPFTCIAGANGIGKSNVFDAIEFLSLLASETFTEAAQRVRSASGFRGGDPRELFWDGYSGKEHTMRVIQQGVSSFSCIVLTSEYMAACRERRRPVS